MTYNYSNEELKEIGRMLDKPLGPEFLSQRVGPAGKLTYIEGRVAINLANSIFGFNGWHSEIKDCTVDYADQLSTGKFNVGVAAVVRITLKDGTFHEDVGYGTAENARSKGTAFEQARKQAVTDAMKRTLRIFGNALGNCLYDRSYLTNIGRMANPQIKFDPSDLYRHEQMREKLKKEEVATSTSAVTAAEAVHKSNMAKASMQTHQAHQTHQWNQANNNPNQTNRTYQANQANQANQINPIKQANNFSYAKKETPNIPAAITSAPESSERTDLRSPLTQPLIHEDSFCYEGDDALFLHLADQEALERMEPEDNEPYEEMLEGIRTPPPNEAIVKDEDKNSGSNRNKKRNFNEPMEDEFSVPTAKYQRTSSSTSVNNNNNNVKK